MATHSFHLGDILSITTGALVSPRHMEGVHDILDFMTGDSLFTHQLPRAARECTPNLRIQHPDIAQIEAPQFRGKDHVDEWLAEQVGKFGEYRDVAPLAAGDHTVIDPLSEMAMNYPHVKVIPIDMGGDR